MHAEVGRCADAVCSGFSSCLAGECCRRLAEGNDKAGVEGLRGGEEVRSHIRESGTVSGRGNSGLPHQGPPSEASGHRFKTIQKVHVFPFSLSNCLAAVMVQTES